MAAYEAEARRQLLRSISAALLTNRRLPVPPICEIIADYARFVATTGVVLNSDAFFESICIDTANDGSILATDHRRLLHAYDADEEKITDVTALMALSSRYSSYNPTPIRICADPTATGRYFLADYATIGRTDGKTVGRFVGNCNAPAGFADGVGSAARFEGCSDVCSNGVNLFVADRYNHRLRAVDIGMRRVWTIAGDGRADNIDGIGKAASISYPNGLAIVGSALYVTTTGIIRRFDIDTGDLTTVRLAKTTIRPRCISSTPSGLLIVSCSRSLALYAVDPATGAADPIEGRPSVDSVGFSEAVQNSFCIGMTVDRSAHRLWIARFRSVRWLTLPPHLF